MGKAKAKKKTQPRVRSRIVYGLVFPGGKVDVDSISEVWGRPYGMLNDMDKEQGVRIGKMRIVDIREPVGECRRAHWNGKT